MLDFARIDSTMKITWIIGLVFTLWLSLATSYWRNSHIVYSHNPWECFEQTCFNNSHEKVSLNVCRNKKIDVYKTIKSNNVHLCLKTKSTHSLTRKTRISTKIFLVISYDFLSKDKYQSGPSIKWWEGICLEKQRSNILENITNTYENIAVLCLSKKHTPYDVIYRTTMAEASSTKNMDICVIDENEIINTSQKRTTSAIVTTTQKKAKSKKVLGSKHSSLWLGFHALNHINKQKEQPMESGETTRELMKKKIDFDEAKEMQNARPSFPYVPQREWPSKREDGKEGQHYNLTQLPFDVEVDENRFSFDYQVSIHFELGEQKWERDVIMQKIKERLIKMNIELGELIGEPIAVLCFHKSTM